MLNEHTLPGPGQVQLRSKLCGESSHHTLLPHPCPQDDNLEKTQTNSELKEQNSCSDQCQRAQQGIQLQEAKHKEPRHQRGRLW